MGLIGSGLNDRIAKLEGQLGGCLSEAESAEQVSALVGWLIEQAGAPYLRALAAAPKPTKTADELRLLLDVTRTQTNERDMAWSHRFSQARSIVQVLEGAARRARP